MKKLLAMGTGIAIGLALVVSMSVSMFGCSASRRAGSSRVDSLTASHVVTMISSRLYKIDFDRAFPVAAPSFPLNYPYFVSVIGDRIESYLPYFGRAYSIPYGGGEGLRFATEISDYRVSTGRSGQYEISFDATTAEDNHSFSIEIYPTGEAYLTVTSNQRQSISFSGHIDLDPEFEAIRIGD